jgi:tetratricopeptide (TPR) repeat protein
MSDHAGTRRTPETTSMRIQFRRVAVGTAAVGLLAGVLAWRAAGQPPAAVPLPAGGPVSADAKKKDGLRSLEAMTFPSDRNARQMIQAVKDYLEEHKDKPNAPWDKICFAAQQVLDEKSDSFFEVTRKDDDTGKVQRVSAKAEANRLIGGFPPAGRQFYQLTYGPPAEAALAAARQNGYDRLALADISQRFFHTKAGAQATLLLAGLHLDRGNYVEAAYSFERLLARPESDDVWTPLATFKALVAFRRAGGQPPEAIKALTDQLAKKFPRDGLVVGRRRFDLDALKEELDRPVETLFGKVGEAYVALRYGNASHTAVADGGRPFLDPAAQLSTVHPPPVPRTPGDDAPAADPFNTSDGGVKVQQNLEQVLRGVNPAKGEVALPGSFPVTAPGRIVFRTYFGLMAVATVNGRVVTDPKTGQPGEDHYWISTTRGNLSHLFAEEGQTVEPWWQYYRDQVNLRSLLYDNPLLGSLAHDGRLVYVVDDAAIPQPPVQQNNEFGIVPPGGPLPQANPKLFDGGNRLLAVDLVEGSLKWELGLDFTDGNDPPMTEEDEDRQTNPLLLMQKSFFLGPPLPLNGKLYVLFEKNGRIRLACLDPSRMKAYKRPKNREGFEVEVTAPELVWTQRLGEPNVRLPADAYRRFQCSYLAYADGVMVCPTNAGAVVAVDVMSRSLLWARSYRAVKAAAPNEGQPVPGAFGRGRIGMGNMAVNQGGSPLPTDRWRAAAPVVSNGRVVFAAYDSESVDCLDLRTGDLLWTEPRRNTDLYVGGLVGDKVVIVGKESVRAVKLVGRPREKAGTSGREEAVAAWPDLRVGTPAGHGAASKGGVYYLPLANTPDGSQPEVWAIDVENGQVLAKTAYRKREAEGAGSKPTLGNLVFHEGQLFAQGPTELVGFPLIDRKKREMDERLLANPKDPVGLLARGELNLDDGKLIDAVRDLKEADRNGPPDDLRPRLRDKLYQAYTELLRKDFTAGEPFLAEYRALCDVPADTDDPNALQRLKDEQFRRKTLFLVLLAKGREKQGRLAEAFDHYREFAGLGDNKQLVTIYDEPIGQTRPDVWARGRIEAMLRAATDPAARKPLDERVAAAWAEVKGTDDTDKLREFVRVFGRCCAPPGWPRPAPRTTPGRPSRCSCGSGRRPTTAG